MPSEEERYRVSNASVPANDQIEQGFRAKVAEREQKQHQAWRGTVLREVAAMAREKSTEHDGIASRCPARSKRRSIHFNLADAFEQFADELERMAGKVEE